MLTNSTAAKFGVKLYLFYFALCILYLKCKPRDGDDCEVGEIGWAVFTELCSILEGIQGV